MQHDLEYLIKEIHGCRLCADALRHEPRPVLRASRTARLCVAGQAPGTRVHKTGIPFNDPSGDRLRTWMGVDRDAFFDESRIAIIPMGFCFPGLGKNGSDLPPRKECANEWRERLFERMPQIELTILVGQYAQRWHLGKTVKCNLTQTVRSWRAYSPDFLPLPHPSWRNNHWLKANPWFEEDVLPELQKSVAALIQ